MMRRHAFVTGAGGFIGGHLVRELAHAGWSVTGLVRQPEQAALIESQGGRAVLGDLCDPSLQVAGVASDTVVFHLAAALTTWAQGVDEGRSTTENLIRLMARNGAERLILISSASVHGPSHGSRIVDESLPLGPHPPWHHYVRQKLAVEALVRRAQDEGVMSTTIVRPTRVLGPGDRRLVSWATKLATWAAGTLAENPNRRHPVVVVGELARGLVACAESPVTQGRAYYLSSSIEITKCELVDAFIAAGMPSPRRSAPSSLGLAAGRVAYAALGTFGRAARPQSAGPRAALIAALERRAGMPVGHDCVVASRQAGVDFGWRGLDDIEFAILQAVRWHSEREIRQHLHHEPMAHGA